MSTRIVSATSTLTSITHQQHTNNNTPTTHQQHTNYTSTTLGYTSVPFLLSHNTRPFTHNHVIIMQNAVKNTNHTISTLYTKYLVIFKYSSHETIHLQNTLFIQCIVLWSYKNKATQTGFEPVTLWLTATRSNLLSYWVIQYNNAYR